MAAPHLGEKLGCSRGDQLGTSEWNYHGFCWDTGVQNPEGTAGTLDNCPISSLNSRCGNGNQQTLPVKRCRRPAPAARECTLSQ